ncbi:hypothetical protein GJ496_010412 [Pomphorhynchus laevis]|nr:hypothetical protein GJ496_010412 [Pomphorhynchus laevis]
MVIITMDYYNNGFLSSLTIKSHLSSIKLSFIYTSLVFQIVNCRLLIYPPSLSDSSTSVKLQNCGGLHELTLSAEKCGVCGSSLQIDKFRLGDHIFLPPVTLHTGSHSTVQIKLPDFRPGWIEFRICKVISIHEILKQDCFDRNILNILDSNMTRLYLKPEDIESNLIKVSIHIPEYLTCERCVLQLKYRTYDTINIDPSSSIQCQGCGVQEIFQDCSLLQIHQRQTSDYIKLNPGDLKQKKIHSYHAEAISDHYGSNVDENKGYFYKQSSKRFNRDEPPSLRQSSSHRWLTPKVSYYSETDESGLVCMSRSEYNQFRETVDMLEYLVHKLKHESLRELTVSPSNHQPNEEFDEDHDRQVETQSSILNRLKLRAATTPNPNFAQRTLQNMRSKIIKDKIHASPKANGQKFSHCKAIGTLENNMRVDRFCEINCRRGVCNRRSCQCERISI